MYIYNNKKDIETPAADPNVCVKVNTSLKISETINLIWINLRTTVLTADLKISIYYSVNLIGVNKSYWFSRGIITRLQHAINIQ